MAEAETLTRTLFRQLLLNRYAGMSSPCSAKWPFTRPNPYPTEVLADSSQLHRRPVPVPVPVPVPARHRHRAHQHPHGMHTRRTRAPWRILRISRPKSEPASSVTVLSSNEQPTSSATTPTRSTLSATTSRPTAKALSPLPNLSMRSSPCSPMLNPTPSALWSGK